MLELEYTAVGSDVVLDEAASGDKCSNQMAKRIGDGLTVPCGNVFGLLDDVFGRCLCRWSM